MCCHENCGHGDTPKPLEYVRKLTHEELAAVKNHYGADYYKYCSIKELSVMVGTQKVTVPVGFLTDGCSGPFTLDTRCETAWLVHDWLYATHEVGDKELADSVLKEIPVRELVAALCGCVAWEGSFKRGPQFIQEAMKH
ncbi:hypothetical protein Pelo_15238 [Pelomyxa schiedti]|nr:hypothetical protein Pelo_15238 [Pelomyxa schiedti]